MQKRVEEPADLPGASHMPPHPKAADEKVWLGSTRAIVVQFDTERCVDTEGCVCAKACSPTDAEFREVFNRSTMSDRLRAYWAKLIN